MYFLILKIYALSGIDKHQWQIHPWCNSFNNWLHPPYTNIRFAANTTPLAHQLGLPGIFAHTKPQLSTGVNRALLPF